MREVAGHLGVSVSTVVSVYRDLTTAGRSRTEVGNGSFLLPAADRRKRKGPGLKLAINLRPKLLQDSRQWHYHVFSGITMAALYIGEPVTILPIGDTPADQLKEVLADFDVLLACAGGQYQDLALEFHKTGSYPVIFLNPPSPAATADFVSANFFEASRHLGRTLLETGRKKFLYINAAPVHHVVSTHWRMMGAMSGYQLGVDPAFQFLMEFSDGDTSIHGGKKALQSFVRKHGYFPDAIYTDGDYLALGCLSFLEEEGIRCPEEVSVIGGTGMDLSIYDHPNLTRMRQPFEEVGREVIKMVRAKLSDPSQVFAGVVVDTGWMGGTTTREMENKILFAL